jgi:hypothetical protein
MIYRNLLDINNMEANNTALLSAISIKGLSVQATL